MPLSEKTKYEVEIKVIYKWAELIDGTGEENSLSKCWEKFEAATLRTEHRVGTLSEENLPLLAEIVESIAKEYEEISQAEALEHAQALAKMTWFKKCIFEGSLNNSGGNFEYIKLFFVYFSQLCQRGACQKIFSRMWHHGK